MKRCEGDSCRAPECRTLLSVVNNLDECIAMAIYWTYSAIPEFARRCQAERDAAVKQVSSLAIKRWEWWAALVVAGGCAGLGAWLAGRGVSGVVGAGIGGAIGGAFHYLVAIYLARKYHANILLGRSEVH